VAKNLIILDLEAKEKKNKLIKKAAFEKHQELMKKGYEKRKAIYLKMMEERDQRTKPEEKLENM